MIIAVLIGLGAGLVGGLCGIGGSIIMLPALGLVFGYQLADGSADPNRSAHHVYMAAAMLVNVVIAWASTLQHKKAGAEPPQVVAKALPSMILGIIAGVLASNIFSGSVPKIGLGIFMVLAAAWTAFSAVRKLPDAQPEDLRATWGRVGPASMFTGFLAGFLGIGGGIVLVPLLQICARVPMKASIATSANVMRTTAIIGAGLKLATLPSLGVAVDRPVLTAAVLGVVMGLGGVVGALAGARLTHRLPLRELRLAFAVVLVLAALKLVGWL